MTAPLPDKEAGSCIRRRRREPHRHAIKFVDHIAEGEEVQFDIVVDPDVEVRRHGLDQQRCSADERRGIDLLDGNASVRDLDQQVPGKGQHPRLPTDRVDPEQGDRVGQAVPACVDVTTERRRIIGIESEGRVDADNQEVHGFRRVGLGVEQVAGELDPTEVGDTVVQLDNEERRSDRGADDSGAREHHQSLRPTPPQHHRLIVRHVAGS